MIKKRRKYPLKLKKAHALLRRLHPLHPTRLEIEEDLKKNHAGFRGEKELDYHLGFLPQDDYFIYQGLQLPGFQIDCLVLCSRFAVIIESKNFSGTLTFDSSSHQFYRTKDNQKEGFPDPILQAKRHKIKLQKWLTTHKLKPLPIQTLISIAFPTTIIETDNSNYHLFETVTHAERIPDKIAALFSFYPEVSLSPYHLKKWNDTLLTEDQAEKFDALAFYQIKPTDFTQGISCRTCYHNPMKRIYGKWKCPGCQATSRKAHVGPILDHLLLVNQLTNQDAQRLLHFSTTYTVSRLLSAMKLPFTGDNKGRVYYYPY
ncbi:nuclease-related domain-containing protein [Ammoniphilus sp. CFH 90114]|uniref:nuclease-related domain-containing protein n=1 Tax=Ammoniphilus sp. CFH 90114 TaxID=2493665 RepID=UPI00100EB080|nr:nuclease-related domain-containing protein [Ammoniphilus sp. CFH 90114]RXT04340.1 NERD domain-containing protein [Ammoniphilus sp. CFH 90114]